MPSKVLTRLECLCHQLQLSACFLAFAVPALKECPPQPAAPESTLAPTSATPLCQGRNCCSIGQLPDLLTGNNMHKPAFCVALVAGKACCQMPMYSGKVYHGNHNRQQKMQCPFGIKAMACEGLPCQTRCQWGSFERQHENKCLPFDRSSNRQTIACLTAVCATWTLAKTGKRPTQRAVES